MNRRNFFSNCPLPLAVVMAAVAGTQAVPLDGKERLVGGVKGWEEKFKIFMRSLNHFIEAYNEGVWDRKRWEDVVAKWQHLHPPTL